MGQINLQYIYLFIISIPLLLAMVMFAYTRLAKVYSGVWAWGIANFTFTVAFVLFSVADHLGTFGSLVLPNSLLVLALFAIVIGYNQFFGYPVPFARLAALWAMYTAAQLALVYLYPSLVLRIVLISVVLATSLLWMAIWLWRLPQPTYRRINRFSASIMIFLVALSAVRLVITITNPPTTLVSDERAMLIMLAAVLLNIGLAFSTVLLNSTRQSMELATAYNGLELANAELTHRMDHMDMLTQAGERFALATNSDQIFAPLLTMVPANLGAEFTAICAKATNGGHPGILASSAKLNSAQTSIINQHKAQLQASLKSGQAFFLQQPAAAILPLGANGGTSPVALWFQQAPGQELDENHKQTLLAVCNQARLALEKAAYHATVQEQLNLLTTIQTASQVILTETELRQIFQTVLNQLRQTYNYPYIAIFSIQGEQLALEASIGYDPIRHLLGDKKNKGVFGRCLRTQKAQFVPNVDEDPDFVRLLPDVRSEVCVPVVTNKRAIGGLMIESTEARPLGQKDLDLLTQLATPVGIAIENARLHQEVLDLALTDPLTNLHNRRSFNELLQRELTRARRYTQPFAVLIMDVDDFKKINDTLGHLVGDDCLIYVADLLRQVFRASDSIARYGGDEFAVILPNITQSDALAIISRFLHTSMHCDLPESLQGKRVTFSIGLAAYPQHGSTQEELVRAADQAELNAKQHGKNKVCVPGEC